MGMMLILDFRERQDQIQPTRLDHGGNGCLKETLRSTSLKCLRKSSSEARLPKEKTQTCPGKGRIFPSVNRN